MNKVRQEQPAAFHVHDAANALADALQEGRGLAQHPCGWFAGTPHATKSRQAGHTAGKEAAAGNCALRASIPETRRGWSPRQTTPRPNNMTKSTTRSVMTVPKSKSTGMSSVWSKAAQRANSPDRRKRWRNKRRPPRAHSRAGKPCARWGRAASSTQAPGHDGQVAHHERRGDAPPRGRRHVTLQALQVLDALHRSQNRPMPSQRRPSTSRPSWRSCEAVGFCVGEQHGGLERLGFFHRHHAVSDHDDHVSGWTRRAAGPLRHTCPVPRSPVIT